MTGGFGRGMKFFRDQQEQLPSSGFVRNLWLKQGEVAKIQFITDADEFLVPLVHPQEKKIRTGKTINTDVLCARRALESDASSCPLCVAGEKGPWPRTTALVWVEQILHPAADGERKWQPIARPSAAGGTVTMYREMVEGVRILSAKPKLIGQLEREYTGVAPGALFDDGQAQQVSDAPPRGLKNRWFSLERQGEGAQSQELLQSVGDAPLPQKALEELAKLPSFEDIIVQDLGGKPQQRGGGAVQHAPADDRHLPAADAAAANDGELVSF